MLKKFALIFLMVICNAVSAQTYFEFKNQAERAGREQNFQEATDLYRQGFSIHSLNRRDFYNAACFASRAGNLDQAFEWLESAIRLGYQNIAHLRKDVDLERLHDDPRWPALLSSFEKKIALAEEKYNKPLQRELLQIFKDDQDIRTLVVKAFNQFGQGSPQFQKLEKKMIKIDQANLKKVKAIIAKYGWVNPDQVGSFATNALFTVIQHADLDVQQHYLPMVREAVKHPLADPTWLAYLEDRIAVREGKKQRYGTQLSGKAGQLDHTSLEDPENIDERRAKLGLPRLPDSLKLKH